MEKTTFDLMKEELQKKGLNGEKWGKILKEKIPVESIEALNFLKAQHLKSIHEEYNQATSFEKERLDHLFKINEEEREKIEKESKINKLKLEETQEFKIESALTDKGLGKRWAKIIMEKIPVEHVIGLQYLRPQDLKKIKQEYNNCSNIEKKILDEIFKNSETDKKSELDKKKELEKELGEKNIKEEDSKKKKLDEEEVKNIERSKKLLEDFNKLKDNTQKDQEERKRILTEIIGQFKFNPDKFRQTDNMDKIASGLENTINEISKSNNLVSRTDYKTNELIEKIDGGGLLKGFLLNKRDVDETLKQREQLIEIPDNVIIQGTHNEDIIREITTKSQKENASYFEVIKKSGNSIGVSAGGGYMGVSVTASFNYSEAKEDNTIEKNSSMENYISKFKYSYTPIMSTEFKSENLRISIEAINRLKEVEANYSNPNITQVLIKEFFEKFGSHAFLGPFDFGGTFILNAFLTYKSTEKTSEAVHAVSSKIDTGFSASYLGVASVSINVSHDESTATKDVNFNKLMSENTKLNITKRGGAPECNNIDAWKHCLTQYNSTWTVISYGDRNEKVWNIILRNHKKDFIDAKRLAGMLSIEYNKYVNSYEMALNDIEKFSSSIIYQIRDINNHPHNEFCIAVSEFINCLSNFKKQLLVQTCQLNSWEMILANDEMKKFLMRLSKEVLIENLTKIAQSNLVILFKILPQNYSLIEQQTINPYIANIEQSLKNDDEQIDTNEKFIVSNIEDFNTIAMRIKEDLIITKSRDEQNKVNENMNRFFNFIEQYLKILDEEALLDNSEINLGNLIYPGYGNTKMLILQILCCCHLNYDIEKEYFYYSVSEKEIDKFCVQFIDSIFRFTSNFSSNKYKNLAEKYKLEFYHRLFCFLCFLVMNNIENFQLNKPQINKVFDHIKKSWSVLKLQKDNENQNNQELSLDLFVSDFKVDYLLTFHSLEILRKISFEFMELTEINQLKQNDLQNLPINDLKNINSLLKDNEQKYEDQGQDSLLSKQENLVGVTSEEFLSKMMKIMNRTDIITRKESKICVNRNILLSIEKNDNIGMEMFLQILNKNPSVMKMKFKKGEKIEKEVIENEGFDDNDEAEEGFESDSKKTEPDIKPRNVLDYLISIYYISEHAVREILAVNLDICKLSIPLVLPKGEILLWQLYNISKSFKDHLINETVKKEKIVNYPSPIISFIKLGYEEFSKSDLINSTFYNHHPVFSTQKQTYEQNKPEFSDGLIEISWLCPEKEASKTYKDMITILNLRGSAEKSKNQIEFIRSISDILIIITDSKSSMNLIDFNEKDPFAIVLSKVKDVGADKLNKKIVGISRKDLSTFLKDLVYDTLWGDVNIYEKYNKKTRSFIDYFNSKNQLPLNLDIENTILKESYNAAFKFIDLMGKDNKNQVLPLQSKSIWGKLVSNEKQLNRLNKETDISQLKIIREQLSIEIKQLRQMQQNLSNNLHPAMKFFLKQLLNMNLNEKIYFIEWVSLMMNNKNEKELQKPRYEYSLALEKHNKAKSGSDDQKVWKLRIKELGEQIFQISFGMEHVIREIGQIYESIMFSKNNQTNLSEENLLEIYSLINNLPKTISELMLYGLSVELMDGDNTFVQISWISALFDNLHILTNKSIIGVCSILGTQSTGKSTMLNSMFNLKFAVAASRCTKGIFMQLIELDSKINNMNYLLILDTEGLRAPELLESTTDSMKHDNEMATTVISISDLSLINMMNLTNPSIIEILEIVVHAIIRINNVVSIKPKTMFSHQNVNLNTDPKNSNYEAKKMLLNHLNKMTKSVADLEGLKINSFEEVIPIEGEDQYISPLFEGNGANLSISKDYVENIELLKREILKILNVNNKVNFSNLALKLNDLWKAIIRENFTFAFQNTLQLNANSKIEKKYNEYAINYCYKLQEFYSGCQKDILNGLLIEEDFNKKSEIKTFEFINEFKEDFGKFIRVASSDNEYFKEYETSTEKQVIKKIQSISEEYKLPVIASFQEVKLRKQMKDKLSNIYDELFSKARDFIAKNIKEKEGNEEKDKKMTKEEIEIKFNIEVWNDIVSKFRSCLAKNDIEIDPKQDALIKIKEEFSIEANLYNELLKKGWPQDPVINYDFMNLKNSKSFFNTGTFTYRTEAICIKVLKDHERRKEDLDRLIAKIHTNLKYDPSIFVTAIQDIKKLCLLQNCEFYYLPNYMLYLNVILCNNVFEKLESLVNIEKDRQNPLKILERDYKNTLIDKLYMMCNGINKVEQNSSLIVNATIKKIDSYFISKEKNNKIFKEISSRVIFIQTKKDLMKEIQKELLTKFDWELGRRFISDFKDATEYFIMQKIKIEIKKEYIGKALETQLNSVITLIKDNVETLGSYVSLSSWLANFKTFLSSDQIPIKIILDDKELSLIDDILFQDSKNNEVLELDPLKKELKDIIMNKLENYKISKVATFKIHENDDKTKENKDLVNYFCDDDLIEIRNKIVDVVKGCSELCPFCKTPCEYTIPDHPEHDHESNYHRFGALFGDTLGDIGLLCNQENCNGMVSDKRWLVDDPEILQGKGKYYYNDYKQHFPRWKITGDKSISDPSFWKWFIGKFQQQIKNLFNQKTINKGSKNGITGWMTDISSWTSDDIYKQAMKQVENYGDMKI